MKKLLLLVALVAFTVTAILWFLSASTVIVLEPSVSVLGMETPVRLLLENPHGVRRVTASVEQDGRQYSVYQWEGAADRFFFWRKDEPVREVSLKAGTRQAAALRDGKAKLVIEVRSDDFRGRTDTKTVDVEVNTRPPALSVDTAQHYLNHGGAELVTFSVSGYWTEAGVRVGKREFRSYPMPGSPAQRFSLFAFSWDEPAETVPLAFARNPTGKEVTARFWCKVFPKKFRKRDLTISDELMSTLVESVTPKGEGDLLSRFLRINGEMRRQNNQTLAGLRLKTEERFLWNGPFLQLANSKVESQFADTRAYIYNGKEVDEQTHLGFDLSVTRNVDVVAANDGKVVFADNLGIYGNCIVVDHGYGLQSIYAHLSRIAVKPGESVAKGQAMGKSGATGLAAGDHLHFSMQVDGVQVTPIEWWDGHWIQDRILGKLPPA